MTKPAITAIVTLCLLAASPRADLLGQDAPKASYTAARDYAQWEKEIAAYEATDRQNPPPKGGTLFIGSSTIRLWKTLAADFPDHKVVNRGFGGSEIVDSTHFADRLIFPHEPRQIILRAGGNDIHDGRTPKQVAADFAEFVRVVHARLPRAEILYNSVSPAPSRWGESDKYRELNRLIREMAPGNAPGRVHRDVRHGAQARRTRPPRAFRQGPAALLGGRLQAARRARPAIPGELIEARDALRRTSAVRTRDALDRRKDIAEERMFGGPYFLINGRMLVGFGNDAPIHYGSKAERREAAIPGRLA